MREGLLLEMQSLHRAHLAEMEAKGLANHVGCKRFSSQEQDRLAEVVAYLQQQPKALAIPEGPSEPPHSVQCNMQELAEALGPSCEQPRLVPWWARFLCRNREEFRGVALTAAEGSGLCYMMLYAKASPP